MNKTRYLPYIGYAKLRPGKIHLFCPICKRKMSNVPRDFTDPPDAVLVHIVCDKCGHGGWIEGPECYLDANGRKRWPNVDRWDGRTLTRKDRP